MLKTTDTFYAWNEDEEHWQYDDSAECAQAAYDDGVELVDGKLLIYSGTLSYFQGKHVITSNAVQRMFDDFCDNGESPEDFANRVGRLDVPTLQDLATRLATAMEEWAAQLPPENNPFKTGVIENITKVYVDAEVLDITDNDAASVLDSTTEAPQPEPKP